MVNNAISIDKVVLGVKSFNNDPAFLKKLYNLENVIDMETLEKVIEGIENNYVGEEKDIIEIYRNLFGITIDRLQEEFKSIIHNEENVNSNAYRDNLCRAVFNLIYSIEVTGCSHLFPEYIQKCKNMLVKNAPLNILMSTRDYLKDDLYYNGYVALMDDKNIYKIMNDIVKEKYLLLGLDEFNNVLNTKYSYLNSLMLKYQDYCKVYRNFKNICSFGEYQEEKKQDNLRNVLKR